VAVIGKHGAVVSSVKIDARPETVFEFFTQAEKMARWIGLAAELEGRPGGAWRVAFNEHGWVAAGELVQAEPPERLVFTWGWEGSDVAADLPPGSSTVEVTFTPDGDGTVVRLEHRDLPPDLRIVHGLGWEHALGRLAVAATGGEPGPSPLESMRRLDELRTLEG
jgi:uncharacterized protein YndB with AHSA1/START domain